MWREQLDLPIRVPLQRVHQGGTWTVSVQSVWLAQGLIPRMIFTMQLSGSLVLLSMLVILLVVGVPRDD
jgi:apolipoprotein N-acyltransferase